MISYCYGTGTTDAHPKMFEAPDFDGFVNQVLAFPRARTKETRKYICAPLRRNGSAALHRCKIDVLPRAWLGHDVDGGDRDEVEILLMRLPDYRAVAWQTARSTPECPRWRIVVCLDREVDHAEGVRLGAALVGVLGDRLPSLKWDRSTHQGEQPCFLPMASAQVMQYYGDAVDVDAVLALTPEEPPRARPATPDPYEALIIERGLFLHEIDPSKAAITCPFEAEHSEKTSDSSTVYFRPLHGGYRWGRIHCSHTTHCADRTQEDFIRALGAEPREVWGGQVRGEEGKGNGKAKGPGKAGQEEAWPKHGHIARELLPVPALDPAVLLPEPLRGWIEDQAEGMPCPIEFIAVPAIVMAGSVIGARCGLRPKVHSHWISIPNLWGGIIGGPGTKKSPALDAASRPLGRLIKEARAAHAEAMEDYNARKGTAEDDEKDFAEIAPTEKRYRANDATIEKLADLLIENPTGLLVQRDELVGLIASWDKQGHEQDRALYLESWNGYSDYWIDRIKRGSSYLPNLCLSVLGGIQPTKLAAYLDQSRDALADDGMLQRFQMLVYPDPVCWEDVDRAPNVTSLTRAYGIFKALADMVPSHWGAGSDKLIKFPYFKFHRDAQAVFNDWHSELHRDRIPAEENPLLAQWLSKADNLFLGLALIFHLIDIADTQIPRPGETLDEAAYMPSWAAWVRVDATRRAAAWCEFLEAHARRVYGMQASDELRAAQALAAKVRGGKLEDGFTPRDVIRARWHGLTTRTDIEAALAWLEEEGWLRTGFVGAGKKGGRPTTRYLVNPSVRDGVC